ncbi:MAG: hypothetical protein KA745_00355 [Gemmatimonadales bacterium]|nr:hypothetical protein [Gemmatimonadales bacterium]
MIPPPPTEFWSIERANAERAVAVARFGFTDRQARFLVQVLLHSGVFVERQFCQFAGIAHGQKSADFLTKLVSRRYATPITTGALHRGRLFHVHYKPLWAAIGEPDSRFRKPAMLGRLIERVMILDAVLAEPKLVWLGPAADKMRFLAGETDAASRLRQEEYPHLCFGEGAGKVTRYFPDKLPIGATASGSPHVFLYLVTKPSPVDFRAFLLRHAELLRAVREWTIRLLFPRSLSRATLAYQHAARDHLVTRLDLSVGDELLWFFGERKRQGQSPSNPAERPNRRLREAVKAFSAPRFSALYRAWLAEGDIVVWRAQSSVTADAVSLGRGRLECVVLSRQYLHLSRLVGVA